MSSEHEPRPFPGTAAFPLALDFGWGVPADAPQSAVISIANTMRRFNVPRYAAVDALVCFRTAIHNDYVARRNEAGIASACNEVGIERERFDAVLAELLDEIDANDDVMVRLDSNVANRLREPVPVVSDLDRRSNTLEAVAGLSAHDAAWQLLVALPRGTAGPRPEPWAQLELPLDLQAVPTVGPPAAPERPPEIRLPRLRPLINCAVTRRFAGSFRLTARIRVSVCRPRLVKPAAARPSAPDATRPAVADQGGTP